MPKYIKPYPNETLALGYKAFDIYTKEINRCLNGTTSGEGFDSENLENFGNQFLVKSSAWSTAFDQDKLRKYDSKETAVKAMIEKLKREISGEEKLDQISINQKFVGVSSYEFLEEYMASFTNWEFQASVSKKLGKFNNYQRDTYYGNCKVSRDTWKFYKKDCLKNKSTTGEYVDLTKNPQENLGKKSCMAFENFDKKSVIKRYSPKNFEPCNTIPDPASRTLGE